MRGVVGGGGGKDWGRGSSYDNLVIGRAAEFSLVGRKALASEVVVSTEAGSAVDEQLGDGGGLSIGNGLGQGESRADAHEDGCDCRKESLELHVCFGEGFWECCLLICLADV